ncbi:MAG TPA: hypothetical protein VIA61_06070 [Methylomirabilota bacterium]|jgi:hypothetical protein
MGPLAKGQRYVVMIQIPGAKTTKDAQKVNKLVAQLKRMGATVKISITGPKGQR